MAQSRATESSRNSIVLTMLIIAMVDALTTQFNFEPWIKGFNISLSVAVLPVLLYFNPRVNPLKQTFVIMGLGLFARLVLGAMQYGTLLEALSLEYKQMFFELTYGVFYFFFFYRRPEKTLTLWTGVILFADFFANIAELLSRSNLSEFTLLQKLPELFLIACLRAALATLLVLVYEYYRDLLRRQEHQKRYERLVMIASQLMAENYLMAKNMQQIESVMGSAYNLYEVLENIGHKGSRQALGIAKDVHEIKKSYYQVMQGLKALTNSEKVDEEMQLKDLLEILKHCLLSEWEGNQELPLQIDCHVEMKLKQHFLMLSLLRNLVINALESVSSKPFPHVSLHIYPYAKDSGMPMLAIEVRDNGHGISEKDVKIIFEPGFSTKFSPLTGDIQRGLGLTLVYEIVTNTYGGTISVKSAPGLGTTFTILLPMQHLVSERMA